MFCTFLELSKSSQSRWKFTFQSWSFYFQCAFRVWPSTHCLGRSPEVTPQWLLRQLSLLSKLLFNFQRGVQALPGIGVWGCTQCASGSIWKGPGPNLSHAGKMMQGRDCSGVSPWTPAPSEAGAEAKGRTGLTPSTPSQVHPHLSFSEQKENIFLNKATFLTFIFHILSFPWLLSHHCY